MGVRIGKVFSFFEDLVDPFDERHTADTPGNVWDYLKLHIAPFRRVLPLMAFVGFLKAALECWIILYGGRLVDLMSHSDPTTFWSDYWLELVMMTLLVLLIRPFFIGLDHLFVDQALGSNMQEQVRWHYHRNLLGQRWAFFQDQMAGRLTNRVMQMGQAVEESYKEAFQAIWFGLAYVLSAMWILADGDLRLVAPLAIWLAAYIFYVMHMSRRVVNASEAWSTERSSTSGRVVDAYANIETVKLFGNARHEKEYALSSLKRLRNSAKEFRRLMTSLAFGINALNGVMIMAVVGPAVWLWTLDAVTVGTVAVAVTLTVRLNGMTGWILFVVTRLFVNIGVIQDGLRTLAKEQEGDTVPDAHELSVTRGAISFQGVTAQYDESKAGIQDIDLVIPGGQKVGIVGPSGAGKSTLLRSLLGFSDVQTGQILIDGQPIQNVTLSSLRNSIAVVSQDTTLLNRSIRENILLGRPGASDAAMEDAARKAIAHDFIQDLADSAGRTGYDAQVGERGVILSGGQRQRILMARAILKDAPILLLDEATSALDSRIEEEMMTSVHGFIEDKTVIAIAHRLSTLKRMDRIVVIRDGTVAEDGSLDELLAQGGLFAEMWARQAGGLALQEELPLDG